MDDVNMPIVAMSKQNRTMWTEQNNVGKRLMFSVVV